LVALLCAGAGVGAVVGASHAPRRTPTDWVQALLEATAAAGTAHFSYTHVATSSNPLLDARFSGSGVVDFSTGAVRVTEVDQQIGFALTSPSPRAVLQTTTVEVVALGTTTYQDVSVDGTQAIWTRSTQKRDPRTALGLSTALNAAVSLDDLYRTRRVIAVVPSGTASVAGVVTTRDVVHTAPACAARPGEPQVERQSPSTVWVDGAGRLVQVSSTVHFTGRLTSQVFGSNSALGRLLSGPSTVTDTLRFSDFGAPVHISAPPAAQAPAPHVSATVTARCAS
jgi:hypothetical protein